MLFPPVFTGWKSPKLTFIFYAVARKTSVKHLVKRGLITSTERDGVTFESGPNAILLSDVLIQNGRFANLAEFPVMQMLYRQGMILPNHPNNTGEKPLLIGLAGQVSAQLQYVYRGNYGLISKEEFMEAGISAEKAEEMMFLKLFFRERKNSSVETVFGYPCDRG